MRYFLISFSVLNVPSIGEICIECESFPSKTLIDQQISDQYKRQCEVVVINIFEFKTKEDYEAYLD